MQSSYEVIFDYLKDTGRKPEDIDMLILTHAHPDHIGSAKAIKEKTGCTVAAHPGGRAWIEDVAVNPLIARSFMSHMGILDRQDMKVL